MRCARKWQARHSDKISFHLESCLVCSLKPVCTDTYTQAHTCTNKRPRGDCICKWNWEVMVKPIRRKGEQRKLEVSLQAETREIKYSSHTQAADPNQYQQIEIQILLSIHIHFCSSSHLFLQYILLYIFFVNTMLQPYLFHLKKKKILFPPLCLYPVTGSLRNLLLRASITLVSFFCDGA